MALNMLLTLFIAGSCLVSARQITFPPVSGFLSTQSLLGNIEPDISQSKFAGLNTYANLPYVHCLAGEDADVEEFDIAILGAPFDTVSYHIHAPFVPAAGLAAPDVKRCAKGSVKAFEARASMVTPEQYY